MKFILDDMLGKLARWLRIMGYDAKYPTRVSDEKIIEIAKDEGRILLTRDRALAKRFIVPSLFILSTDIDEQLVQVIKRFSLDIKDIWKRCPVCNGILNSIEKEEVKGNVPQIVFLRYDEFFLCSSCKKYYWKGYHWDGITQRLKKQTEQAD
ncbi:TPA: hypothetical protein DCX16_01720 [bacterium]|nr:hypothetical protein [bacterium]